MTIKELFSPHFLLLTCCWCLGAAASNAAEHSVATDGVTNYTLDFSNGRNLTTHQLMVNLTRQKPCAHK